MDLKLQHQLQKNYATGFEEIYVNVGIIIIKFKNLNWFFIFLVGFLSFVGLVMIYSATFGEESNILISHVYKIIFGFSPMILFGLVEIEFWKKKCLHFLFYWTCLVNYCLILLDT